MRIIKNKSKRKKIILKIAVIALCIYAIVILINQQIQINNKKTELEELNRQIAVQDIKNDEMENVANSASNENESYIERVVRETLDFAKQGERVFINIAGD